MTDLTDPRVMWLKAVLFVLCGILAGGGVLLEQPTVRSAVLLGLVVWSFCRAYYFTFYVIEHYIDPTFRYAGLVSVLQYLMRERWRGGEWDQQGRMLSAGYGECDSKP